jgi:hypothetical protein
MGVVKLTASKQEIAAGAHLDYVTSGVVLLGEPELGDPKSDNLKPHVAREQGLKKSIEAACGEKIKGLELNLESDHILRIRMQATREAEQEIRRTILAIPALANYQVHFDFQASP